MLYKCFFHEHLLYSSTVKKDCSQMHSFQTQISNIVYLYQFPLRIRCVLCCTTSGEIQGDSSQLLNGSEFFLNIWTTPLVGRLSLMQSDMGRNISSTKEGETIDSNTADV